MIIQMFLNTGLLYHLLAYQGQSVSKVHVRIQLLCFRNDLHDDTACLGMFSQKKQYAFSKVLFSSNKLMFVHNLVFS